MTYAPETLAINSIAAPVFRAKKGSETQNSRFPNKIALFLKKICKKLSFFV